MKYRNCPSCGAPPLQLKAPGVRYDHSKQCNVGRVERIYPIGSLINPSPKFLYHCPKCKTKFTLKDYDNPGDSHTKECPICWATEEKNDTRTI